MNESFPPRIEVMHLLGASVVRVSGTIDERFQPATLGALATRTEPVLIDLDGALRITSFGVREWMRALTDLATERYYFARVRPAFVAQFNSVHQFGGAGRIVSLYCPYVCTDCEHSFDVLVDLRRQRDVILAAEAPTMECPKCKSVAVFDDIESLYFARVLREPTTQLPPGIDAAMDGSEPKRLPLQVHKTVVGELTVLWLSGSLDKGARLKRHTDGLEGTVLVVLEGILTATPEGVSRLQELVRSPSADVYLARAPLDVARGLAADEATRPHTKMISCVLQTRCQSCQAAMNVDVTGWKAEAPMAARFCKHCGKKDVAIEWQASDAALLAMLPTVSVPEVISSYMDAHVDWQTHTSVVGDESRPRANAAPKVIEPGAKIDKYEVVRRIGFGGMADVLLGRQLGLEGFEKKVVIKRILPHLAGQPSFVKMFLEEARIAARLLHPNVVQVYDLLREGDDYYAILEFVRGADLNVLLKVSNQIGERAPPELAARIIADVCGGLEAAHAYTDDAGNKKPIVHRDVSPHNVLLSLDGAVKLTDFGIAKAADSLQDQTGTGVLKGKVIYMPPEAINGAGADHRADIYAAAVTLYQLLAGKNPFHRGGQMPSLRAVLDDPVENISVARREVPAQLAQIVHKGMERVPERRYQTAAAMQADLEAYLAGSGKTANAQRVGTWVRELLKHNNDPSMMAPPPGASVPEANFVSSSGSDTGKQAITRTPANDTNAPTTVTQPMKAAGLRPDDDDWLTDGDDKA